MKVSVNKLKEVSAPSTLINRLSSCVCSESDELSFNEFLNRRLPTQDVIYCISVLSEINDLTSISVLIDKYCTQKLSGSTDIDGMQNKLKSILELISSRSENDEIKLRQSFRDCVNLFMDCDDSEREFYYIIKTYSDQNWS